MMGIDASPILIAAVAVWIPWRAVRWKRDPGDLLRELGVTVLFVWSLVIVALTLSPLRGITNDWGSSISLVPFASIIDMIRFAIPSVARRNIAGNLLLLAPLGVLLPLLFARMRHVKALAWRAAAVSVTIEFLQFISRSRTVDIDDVILNTLGAVAGFALFATFSRLASRYPLGRGFLDRMGSTTQREPLLLAAIPAVMTALVSAPVFIAIVLTSTLGSAGIAADVVAPWPGSRLVASNDANEDAFLVAAETTPDGDERLRCSQYRRVLPGRYTQATSSEMPPGQGSRYMWTLTSTNAREAELPTLVVWGVNHAGATEVGVDGNDISHRIGLPPGNFFVVAVQYDDRSDFTDDGLVNGLNFTFSSDSGSDLSSEFTLVQ